MTVVQRISRIKLICRNLDRLANFYEAAFGFVQTNEQAITEPAFAKLLGISGAIARVKTLQLDQQEIELVSLHPPGRAYPPAVSGRNSLFQHFAIVVSDMEITLDRLSAQSGWSSISTDGPQTLPASSGSVIAYKFRDPEGHPLELIAFAPHATPAKWQGASLAECLGIDHSAISVADTQRSVEFYELLGLRRVGGSINCGSEQDKLDDIAGAIVEVTALAPPQCSTPHVELLCYRSDCRAESVLPGTNDIAAVQLVMKVENEAILEGLSVRCSDAILSGPVRFNHGETRLMLRDPDGHLLCLEAPLD